MSRAKGPGGLVLLAALAAACSGSGLGDSVRKDVTAQMASAQGALSGCYETALKDKRKLRGTMWLRFEIEPKTGKFSRVAVARSQIEHAGLETCVTGAVSGLALAQPQKSVVSIDYPIAFAPLAADAAPAPTPP